MNRTKIEWCRNPDGSPGWTWNPITGCLGPDGDGIHCYYCYAEKLSNGRLKHLYLANKNTSWVDPMGCHLMHDDPFYPRFWPERLSEPHHSGKWRGIFVCNMSDMFGDWVPQQWTSQIFQVFNDCPGHRFYLLTKHPQNLYRFSPFPPNCWVGVSAANTEMFLDATKHLANIDAKLKFVSFEPLLDWDCHPEKFEDALRAGGVKWVIIGGQTKPTIYPNDNWIMEIILAAQEVQIPAFVKDNLVNVGLGIARQEMPE